MGLQRDTGIRNFELEKHNIGDRTAALSKWAARCGRKAPGVPSHMANRLMGGVVSNSPMPVYNGMFSKWQRRRGVLGGPPALSTNVADKGAN